NRSLALDCILLARSTSLGTCTSSGKFASVPLTWLWSMVMFLRNCHPVLYHMAFDCSLPSVVMVLPDFWLLYSVWIHCGVRMAWENLNSSIVPLNLRLASNLLPITKSAVASDASSVVLELMALVLYGASVPLMYIWIPVVSPVPSQVTTTYCQVLNAMVL